MLLMSVAHSPAVAHPSAAAHNTQADYQAYYEAEEIDNRKVAYLQTNILPRIADLPRTANILEIGPGRGALLKELRSSGFLNLSAFEVCRSFADTLTAQGFRITQGNSAVEFLRTLPDASVDALLLIDVLEHFPLEEGLAFLRESRRVVTAQGRIIIQTPNASGLFGINTFVADPTHATPWNELRLTAALKGSGFHHIHCSAMRLPPSVGNVMRSAFRTPVFAAIRFVTRICGATPVRVLTHNLVCEAYPSKN
ncbi:MAG: hypothetical protein RJB13_2049 [Pseudomonadota bacterium]